MTGSPQMVNQPPSHQPRRTQSFCGVDPILELICDEHGVFLTVRGRGARLQRPRDRQGGERLASGSGYDVAPTSWPTSTPDSTSRRAATTCCAARPSARPGRRSYSATPAPLRSGAAPSGMPSLTEVHLTRPDGNTPATRGTDLTTPRRRLPRATSSSTKACSSQARPVRPWSTRPWPTSSTAWSRSTTCSTASWSSSPPCARATPSMAQWPDTLITDLVLRLADGRSESVGETRARYLVWSQGLPPPEVNYPIYDENGREVAQGRPGLAGSTGCSSSSTARSSTSASCKDGETASDVVFREKQREDMICRLTGWRCIRARVGRPLQARAHGRAASVRCSGPPPPDARTWRALP